MSGGIYLVQNDGALIAMREQPYDSEALLQELLARYPNLVAGDESGSATPRRWLLVSREMPVPAEENSAGRWSLDHLYLDPEAVPTLVEVKRSSDTRLRREVVGQMLDYAANAVVYWPVEAIRAQFERNCSERGLDPGRELEPLLDEQEDAGEFWQRVKTNLQAGRIRMVFVADEIPAKLCRVVEFLNTQMDPAEVLAVEIRQYVGEGLRTLVPRLIGQTMEAISKKSGGRREEKLWDEASFLEALRAKRSADEAQVARSILDWAKRNQLRIWWGKGAKDGSFFPMLDHKGTKNSIISVWTYGRAEVQFQWMRDRPPFDAEAKREELRRRLNRIISKEIPADAISRRPSIPLSDLTKKNALDEFIGVLDRFVSEVKAT